MEPYPDPPEGWPELQERMSRAKTPEEINEILKEMKRVLELYEAKTSSQNRRFDKPTKTNRSDRERYPL